MKIGDVSARSGVSQRMIRHYERIGLIGAPARQESGYRSYDDRDLETLRFIGRARDVGFPIEEIRDLLSLWQDNSKGPAELSRLALKHAEDVGRKARVLHQIERALITLAESSKAGDSRTDYPILGSDVAADPKHTPDNPPRT
jgi:MerR family transcriptional regulator, copper efflux regulator